MSITNSTTITATRLGDTTTQMIIGYIVLEFNPGFIKSIQFVSGGAGNIGITEVIPAKTACFLRGIAGTGTALDQRYLGGHVKLNGASHVSVYPGNDGTKTLYASVVEFN